MNCNLPHFCPSRSHFSQKAALPICQNTEFCHSIFRSSIPLLKVCVFLARGGGGGVRGRRGRGTTERQEEKESGPIFEWWEVRFLCVCWGLSQSRYPGQWILVLLFFSPLAFHPLDIQLFPPLRRVRPLPMSNILAPGLTCHPIPDNYSVSLVQVRHAAQAVYTDVSEELASPGRWWKWSIRKRKPNLLV